ncbi:lysine biosynthesis protein LysX [Candidatus Geothermarchaeota archaeon]|nr:MAG: lysine biosynthesis protein LysX [Candidatus Geothermarchaeota archaeon]
MVCDRINWEEKELIKASKKKGVEMEVLNVKVRRLDKISDKNYVNRDLFLQRCISYYRGLYSTAILESKGYIVVNSYRTSSICGNKLLTSLVLRKGNVPTPKTFIAFSKEQALEILAELNYFAIIKPLIGSWGRLVALIQDKETANVILTLREELDNPLHKIFYIQEYIPVRRDIRTFVIGDEVVAAMYRYKLRNDWRSNATIGAKTEPCKITKELMELSLRVAEIVKGEIIGIDILEGKEGLLVSEVNHNPQFKAVTKTTGVKINERIIDYLVHLIRK